MVPSLTPYDLNVVNVVVPYAPVYANGHISTTGDPIHFMFGSSVGFSESANPMALFPVKKKKKKISHRPRWSVAWELIPFAAL